MTTAFIIAAMTAAGFVIGYFLGWVQGSTDGYKSGKYDGLEAAHRRLSVAMGGACGEGVGQ